MSNITKTVLIVTGVLLVCLIGAGIVLGLIISGGHDISLSDIFSGSSVTFDETHSLDLSGVTSISVQCSSGSVTVLPGSEPQAEMKGSLWVSKKKDSYLEVTKENGQIVIKPDIDFSLFNWTDINITVYLPQDCGLNLSVSCASSDTSVQSLNLGDVSVSCASGNTDITGCKGGSLDVEAASGGMDISGSEFSSVRAVCQSGNISISDTAAPCTVSCTSGRITATDVTGALDIKSISGGASVSLSQKDISPIKASVTSGNLDVYLNPEAAFDLDAGATSGGIRCDFDRTVSGSSSGSVVGDHISGKCNGGGVSVTLSTISGNISVLKK